LDMAKLERGKKGLFFFFGIIFAQRKRAEPGSLLEKDALLSRGKKKTVASRKGGLG